MSGGHMLVAGLIKSTLIDYPGKVAAVVFTQGCNFRCGFCHNPGLIEISPGKSDFKGAPKSDFPKLSEAEVLDFLALRVGKLDGVVITGGEPTLQPDLVDFTKRVKALGFSVKLDTNGSNPAVLSSLLSDGLLDYVAMDIKNSPAKYKETCGYPFSNQLQDSINQIIGSGIDYEFRTTVLPAYHNKQSMEELVGAIKSAKKYVLQNFRNEVVYDKKLKTAKSFTADDLNEFKKIAEKHVTKVQIRKNN